MMSLGLPFGSRRMLQREGEEAKHTRPLLYSLKTQSVALSSSKISSYRDLEPSSSMSTPLSLFLPSLPSFTPTPHLPLSMVTPFDSC